MHRVRSVNVTLRASSPVTVVVVPSTYIIDRPFDLVCQHSVHRRNDLHWHVDQSLAEDQSHLRRTSRIQQMSERVVQGWVRHGLLENIICDRLY